MRRPVASLLLRVVLDDELFLDLGVNLGPGRQGVDQDAHLVRDDFHPGGGRPLAGFGARHHHRGQLHGARLDLDDVVLAHPVGRNVHLLSVDHEVTVPDQLARHVPALGEPGPVHHVVQAALQDLEQVLAGHTPLAGGFLVVAVELPLEDAVDPARLLLLPDLEQVLALLGPVPPVLTRRVRPDLDGALRRIALGALQEQLHLLAAAELAVRARVSSHLRATPQTRRRFGGRQPLCGTGVTSWIEPTSRPVACSDRIAVSRPEPGPFTNTSTFRMPCSIARRAAASAAIWAANGVDLREPLKPTCPDEAQEMTLPPGSVIETMVLLNVLLIWACPCAMFLRSFRRTFLTPVRLLGGILFLGSQVVGPLPAPVGLGRPPGAAVYFFPAFFLPATVFFLPFLVRALVCVRCPCTGSP